MAWLKGILQEIVGLFVDDGIFAGAILVWLAIVWGLLPRLDLSPSARAMLLVVRLAAILLESALRRSRS